MPGMAYVPMQVWKPYEMEIGFQERNDFHALDKPFLGDEGAMLMNRKQLLKASNAGFCDSGNSTVFKLTPDDREAMQYYQSAVKEREKAVKEYEHLAGH